jgi:hypothetical protein
MNQLASRGDNKVSIHFFSKGTQVKIKAKTPFVKFELPKKAPKIDIKPPKGRMTTMAVGEEGGGKFPPGGGGATTLAVGEEGGGKFPPGGGATTLAVGEEGSGKFPFPGKPGKPVSDVFGGSEGGIKNPKPVTTMALGEEGGGIKFPPRIATPFIKAKAEALLKNGNVEFGKKAPAKSKIAGPEIPLKSERPFSYSAIPLKDGTFVIKKVLTGGIIAAKPGDGTYSAPILLGRIGSPVG